MVDGGSRVTFLLSFPSLLPSTRFVYADVVNYTVYRQGGVSALACAARVLQRVMCMVDREGAGTVQESDVVCCVQGARREVGRGVAVTGGLRAKGRWCIVLQPEWQPKHKNSQQSRGRGVRWAGLRASG